MRPGARCAFVALLVAAAVGVRFAALGARDLWSDEVNTFDALGMTWHAMIDERLVHGHVPFYFILAKAWTALVGTSQFALRTPSAVAGCLALWPLWRLVRALVPDPRAALFAWTLLAFHPLFVDLSREARMYPLLLIASATAAAACVAQVPSRGALPALFLAAVCGPFLHPSWVAVAFGLLAWRVWLLRDRGRDRRPWRDTVVLALAVSVALCALTSVVLTDNSGQPMDRRAWWAEIGVYALRLFSGEAVRREVWVLNVTVALACGGAAWLGWRRAGRDLRSFAVLAGGGALLVVNAAALCGWTVWGPIRYVQFVAVPLTILVACGTTDAWWRVAVTALFLASVAVQVVPIDRAWSDVAARLPKGAPVVCPDGPSRVVLGHYAAVPVLAAPPAGVEVWTEVETDRGRPVLVRRP